MANYYWRLGFIVFWKGYGLADPKRILKHQIIYELTEAGRRANLQLDKTKPRHLSFKTGENKKDIEQVVKRFIETFNDEIFVQTHVYVHLKTIDSPYADISHEMYNPVGCLYSPLDSVELQLALKTFVDTINDPRSGYEAGLASPRNDYSRIHYSDA